MLAVIGSFPPVAVHILRCEPAANLELAPPVFFTWLLCALVLGPLLDQAWSVLGFAAMQASAMEVDADLGLGAGNTWNAVRFWAQASPTERSKAALFFGSCAFIFLSIAAGNS
jgi:hypothetical protein